MQKSEKKTKIILWAIAALAVLGCALWLLLPHGGTTDCTAEIWIDGKMVRSIYLPQAAEEEIFLEPSACAAFQGPVQLLRTPEGRAYLQAHGLAEKLSSCTHIVWATGGALVPEAIRQTYQKMYL